MYTGRMIASENRCFFPLPRVQESQSNKIVMGRTGRRKGSVQEEKGWNTGTVGWRLEEKKEKALDKGFASKRLKLIDAIRLLDGPVVMDCPVFFFLLLLLEDPRPTIFFLLRSFLLLPLPRGLLLYSTRVQVPWVMFPDTPKWLTSKKMVKIGEVTNWCVRKQFFFFFFKKLFPFRAPLLL